MKKNNHVLIVLLSLVALAGGCTNLAGPGFERPDTPAKETWSASAPPTDAAEIRPDWWNAFGDPQLSVLLEQALSENVDLRVAAGRVERAEAVAGVAGSRLLPVIGASAGAAYGVSRSPDTGRVGTENYDLGGGLNWELDIWGKLRKGQSAALADVQASGADWRAARLALSAQMAQDYFRLRQLDELLLLYDRSIRASEGILSVYEIRAEERLISEDTVLRQRAETTRLARERRDLVRERRNVENGLAALLGKPAGELQVSQGTLSGVTVPEVPAGLPANLLERRPDIMAAEYRVLAAYELAGQARLDRLPSISLTGNGGSASESLGDLLGSWLLSIGPTVNISLFDPAKKAQVKIREAEVQIASDQYRSVVIRAFQETENALVNRASRQDQLLLAGGAVDQLLGVQALVQAKFEEGMVSPLDVLETERSLIQAEQTRLDQQYRLLTDTVTLYKALGGGWSEPDQAPEAQ